MVYKLKKKIIEIRCRRFIKKFYKTCDERIAHMYEMEMTPVNKFYVREKWQCLFLGICNLVGLDELNAWQLWATPEEYDNESHNEHNTRYDWFDMFCLNIFQYCDNWDVHKLRRVHYMCNKWYR